MAKTVLTHIQKRFDDIDVFRHVNNVHQQQYFDVGKTDFYTSVLGADILADNIRTVTVSTHTDYLQQVLFSYDLWVETRVESLGNKSMTLLQELFVSDGQGQRQVLTRSTSVLVAFDFAAQQSVELPARWRSLMEQCG